MCKCKYFVNFAIMIKIPHIIGFLSALLILTLSCNSQKSNEEQTRTEDTAAVEAAPFDADSAYAYIERQMAFGPRVPGTEAHRRAGEWLISELNRHGAEVIEQRATLTAFDGTRLPALNILGRINPDATDRTLLLAHWDCRPWADQDPDESKRTLPVDGANDGASGVGVILEIARQLELSGSTKGVDILFVDAEDWGAENDEDSWALGTRYFVENPPVKDFSPREAILLDMVGGRDAVFPREYFSQQNAPALNDALWPQPFLLAIPISFRIALEVLSPMIIFICLKPAYRRWILSSFTPRERMASIPDGTPRTTIWRVLTVRLSALWVRSWPPTYPNDFCLSSKMMCLSEQTKNNNL